MNERSGRDVLVGIVTLNRLAKLKTTLEECSRHGFSDLLILDNGSTDGTTEFLAQRHDLEVIVNSRNEGASAGFNRIMRYFIEQKQHKWLLLFDDDAFPAFDAAKLEGYLKKKGNADRPAYAFKVTYRDGSLCEMNRPGINILTKNPLRAYFGEHHIQESSHNCPVDFASFVGILLNQKTIRDVGIVSKKFFIYSDDTYYTLSISSKVGKICYCPEFVIIHDCNRSSRSLANHDPVRVMRDVANKIVLIREYSKYQALYIALYVGRLVLMNPGKTFAIARAAQLGIAANLEPYRNEVIA
jgi:GT2 family glycosyltransferase